MMRRWPRALSPLITGVKIRSADAADARWLRQCTHISSSWPASPATKTRVGPAEISILHYDGIFSFMSYDCAA